MRTPKGSIRAYTYTQQVHPKSTQIHTKCTYVYILYIYPTSTQVHPKSINTPKEHSYTQRACKYTQRALILYTQRALRHTKGTHTHKEHLYTQRADKYNERALKCTQRAHRSIEEAGKNYYRSTKVHPWKLHTVFIKGSRRGLHMWSTRTTTTALVSGLPTCEFSSTAWLLHRNALCMSGWC